jgi:glutathione S-transferase
MTDEIAFWTNPRSRGAIVHWMLEEVGAAYRPIVLDYGTTMKAPAYLAINPMGKVPAIRHRGQVVTAAAAICAYLADVFPDAELFPTARERGASYRWLSFGAGPLEAAVTNCAPGVEVPPERRAMVGYGDFDRVVATLAARLDEAPYLAGRRFTAADVDTGSQIIWGLQFGTLPELPALVAYADRIKNRPARARAMLKG